MAPITNIIATSIVAACLGSAAPLSKPCRGDAVRDWVKHSGQSIEWGPCPEGLPENLDCATYNVPLDWNASGGHGSNQTVELAMARIKASDKANRIGSLFVNPGGPGGAATQILASIAGGDRLDPEITARFDVIGLDPRGTGYSTPVQCDVDAYNKRIEFAPKTQKAYDALVQYNKDFSATCLEQTGPLLNYVDTISAVKDHEAVRIALGDEKANFIGLSYGTQLFSQYAELYPNNFRAMVLDGNLQHSQSPTTNFYTESSSYEATLKQFFKWCAGADECPLQGEDIESIFISVRDKAFDSPIPAPLCDDKTCRSDVSGEDLLFTVQGLLIGTQNWPVLGQALLDADKGNATLISSFNSFAVGDTYADAYLYAGAAIACQDWQTETNSLSDLLEQQRLAATFNPLTLGFCQSFRILTSCIGWPAPVTNPPKPVVYKGDVEILQINSLYDPSTSYTWALGLKDELEKTVLVTRNGSGHTSYNNNGEATKIANAYLLNLTLPEPGTMTDS
ncbi:hypothetical protein GGS20DRAFT_552579 [Poronia punctata]|nr:hypothetical protein GGS20DRAFT_552579 [Poronia punctata]